MAKITFRTLGPSPLPNLVINDKKFKFETPNANFVEKSVELSHGIQKIIMDVEWLPSEVLDASKETIKAFIDRGGSEVFIELSSNHFHLRRCYISPEENGKRYLHFLSSALVDEDDL